MIQRFEMMAWQEHLLPLRMAPESQPSYLLSLSLSLALGTWNSFSPSALAELLLDAPRYHYYLFYNPFHFLPPPRHIYIHLGNFSYHASFSFTSFMISNALWVAISFDLSPFSVNGVQVGEGVGGGFLEYPPFSFEKYKAGRRHRQTSRRHSVKYMALAGISWVLHQQNTSLLSSATWMDT